MLPSLDTAPGLEFPRLFGPEWQSNSERGSRAQLTLDLNRAAVKIGHVPNNREAQSGTSGIPITCIINPVEPFEQPREVSRRDTHTRIHHGDDGVAGSPAGGNRHRPAHRRVRKRVLEQIPHSQPHVLPTPLYRDRINVGPQIHATHLGVPAPPIRTDGRGEMGQGEDGLLTTDSDGDDFGDPSGWIAPRQYELGLRLTF